MYTCIHFPVFCFSFSCSGFGGVLFSHLPSSQNLSLPLRNVLRRQHCRRHSYCASPPQLPTPQFHVNYISAQIFKIFFIPSLKKRALRNRPHEITAVIIPLSLFVTPPPVLPFQAESAVRIGKPTDVDELIARIAQRLK